MRNATLMILAAVLVTGCSSVSESNLNPFNWFGPRAPSPADADVANAEINPLIPPRRASIFYVQQEEVFPGQPIADVTEAVLERRPGGAVLRATGQASRVGPFLIRMIPDEDASTDSTLVLDFKAFQQAGSTAAPAQARQVTAARWFTDEELRGLNTITVRGANSARSVRP